MSLVITKPALISCLLASSCIGAGIGYLVAVKKLSAEFDERIAEETANMREFYTNVPKQKFETPQQAVQELILPEVASQALDAALEVYEGKDKIAYHKIAKSDDKKAEVIADKVVDKLIENSEVFEEGRRENIFELKSDPTVPYLITQEDFLNNDTGYVQVSLTYHKIDGKLTDEKDDLIEDIERTVGLSFLSNFGWESSDPQVVHVRNERIQLEFEITESPGSYVRDVMGIDDEPMVTARQRIRGG